jgi:8-amino-7-oxononanoate synthase
MSPSALQRLRERLDALSAQGLRRQLRVVETPCAPEVVVQGRTLLAFNSNDYLGLAHHPLVTEALREGVRLYGAGSGASHLISGHYQSHARLEEHLAALQAEHIPDVRALYFCTGYMANLAVIGALVDVDRDHCQVFSEALNHASIIDAIRLSQATCQIYPHGDVAALAALMERSTARHKLVVTDSVFSMDGDVAPLAELLALCERHDAMLVIDDAHGFGVLGEHGHGILECLGLRSERLVYMGTLGKAAGVSGAHVAAHRDIVEWMVQRARSYIYTTAAAPALAHALLTSLDLITGAEGRARRDHLSALIRSLSTDTRLDHLSRLPSSTAIQPVILGSNQAALQASACLAQRGLWVTAIRAPTVPVGSARLRVTLSAAHEAAHLERLMAALAELRT